MSLLLDALNRASKEKHKAAAAAGAPPSQPVEPLHWEALPAAVPEVPAPVLPLPELQAAPPSPAPQPPELSPDAPQPVRPAPSAPDSWALTVEKDAAPAAPEPARAVESVPPPVPAVAAQVPPAPELAPVPAPVPPPAPAAPVFVPASSTPSMPRHAGIEPAMQVVRDAPPAPPPPQAPPQAVPSPVANNQVAQEILRASAVAPSANTRRRRIVWLGGIAAVLALVLGGVFSGLLGDPAQLLAGGASPPLAAPPPGVAQPEGESAPAPVDATAATTAVADASSASAPVSAPASVAPAVAPVVVPPVAAVGPVLAPAGAVRSAANPQPASKSTPRAATPPNPIRPQTGPQTAKGRAPVPTAPVLADASAPGADTALRAGGLSKSAIVASTRTPGPLEQGYAALLEGRFDAAAQAYGQALRANPQERDALLGMAYISQQKGRRGEAQSYYQEVLRQEPGNAIAVAGLQSLEPGTQSRALNAVVGGSDAGQADSAAAMAANGSALVRAGRLADAAQAFARAQSLEPANPLHAYNHAVAQDRMGRHEMALPLYEAVLQLDAAAPPVLRGYQPEAVRTRVAQLRAAMAPNPAPSP